MSDTPKAAHTPQQYTPAWGAQEMLPDPDYGNWILHEDYATLLQQRDDLLAALEKVISRIERGAPWPDTTAIARAAIARVKEGK